MNPPHPPTRKTVMRLYRIDLRVCATAYVKARSKKEALKKVADQKMDELVVGEDDRISGRKFDDPSLPDISVSPAMTIHGRWGNAVELVEDDVPGIDPEAQ